MGSEIKQIYFISTGEFVKIGIANNPKRRLKDLQTANPIKLNLIYTMPGDENLEKILHSIFDEYRECGEWFRFEGGLKSFIYAFRNNGFWIGQKYDEIPPTVSDVKKSMKKSENENEKFFEVMDNLEDEYGGLAPIRILIEDLLDEHGISPELSKKLILKFKRRGRIFEPQPGYLRVA